VPEIALNISRGCGNPTGFANIQPGDIVVDFGCGAGIDVILAAHKVGEEGKVIGLDFTPQMIDRANQAVAEAGLKDRDIELRVADMGNSELPGNFADVVTSNCVINLCPDKEAVYKEAFSILRSGGRLAISDIVFTEYIDSQLHERFQSTWAGCLGGAIPEEDYMQMVRKAGFNEIQIIARHILTPKELQAMASCPGKEFTPPPNEEDRLLVEGKVASVKFTAVNKKKGLLI
jgi:ubiquinone/menaquinone biosynthesis C-methylase UbiE